MAAMAWMVAVMDSGGMTSGHGGGGAGHSMAGMDMSGGSGMTAMRLVGTGRRLATGLLALVLPAFALCWLARAFDAARAMPAGRPGTSGGHPSRCFVSSLPCGDGSRHGGDVRPAPLNRSRVGQGRSPTAPS
ncbi:DUF5134 domain-containing protein [Streptomyces sp. NPDC048254]|uniref:DUF5134 domain-containing protein n=1 Tax=Streptomyces sp. NPDC048254 TaxID=3365525 RepID=UPI00371129E7